MEIDFERMVDPKEAAKREVQEGHSQDNSEEDAQ